MLQLVLILLNYLTFQEKSQTWSCSANVLKCIYNVLDLRNKILKVTSNVACTGAFDFSVFPRKILNSFVVS